jgi:3-dehydroshikimate dehydratase
MITVGMATDNFRHDDRGLPYVFRWCKNQGLDTVEINTVDGYDFFEGLGFSPALSLNDDGIALRKELDNYALKVSQLDCHYALHRWQSIPYMIHGIKMAASLGCPMIATTDGAEVPPGMTLGQVYDRAVYHIGEALHVARTHKVVINVEPHGPLTTNLELMIKLMRHFDSEYVGINFDTANTFISGADPVHMVRELLPWLRHFHFKDVSPALRASIGKDTGIAASEVHVGGGLNADNMRQIIRFLKEKSWTGVISPESRGESNTLKSLQWVREQVG